MEVQNHVGCSLQAYLIRLRDVPDSAASQGTTGLGQVANRVCDAFELCDGRHGRLERAIYCEALGTLETIGHVSLPPGRRYCAVVRRWRVLAHGVAPAHVVPGEVGELRELALVRVTSDPQRTVWNILIANEHLSGAGLFVGDQRRYVVGSVHGWLGAVGFAASVRWFKTRDAGMGWDDTRRCAPPAPRGWAVPVFDSPHGDPQRPRLSLPGLSLTALMEPPMFGLMDGVTPVSWTQFGLSSPVLR